jgi:hypothetical protein
MLQTFHFLYITLSVQSDFSAPQFAVLFFACLFFKTDRQDWARQGKNSVMRAHNVTKPASSQEEPVLS